MLQERKALAVFLLQACCIIEQNAAGMCLSMSLTGVSRKCNIIAS